MNTLLNPAQAQSLRITLRALELRLHRADLWLQGAEEEGRLYQRALSLPPQTRAQAREAIAEARRRLYALADRFALEPEEEDAASIIRGEMSVSWADLCDTHAAKLRRYGPVAPDLAAALDPEVERLAALALRIATLMDGAPE